MERTCVKECLKGLFPFVFGRLMIDRCSSTCKHTVWWEWKQQKKHTKTNHVYLNSAKRTKYESHLCYVAEHHRIFQTVTSVRALFVVHPVQCHIKALLIIQAMPTNGSDLTIRTNKVFHFAYIFCKAHILKCVHVINQPVSCQCVPIQRPVWLTNGGFLSHCRQKQLGNGKGCCVENRGHNSFKITFSSSSYII